MKTQILIMAMFFSIATGVHAQHNHAAMSEKNSDTMQMAPMFKNKEVGMAYTNYTLVKDALVASNAQEAQKAAALLDKSLASIDNVTEARKYASKIASASSLDEQRKAFGSLGEQMVQLVKENNLSMGVIYLDYCPMAKSNWLSNSKDIQNPYFGEKMLSCGSVKETIQ